MPLPPRKRRGLRERWYSGGHLIWSSDIDIDDWKDDYIEQMSDDDPDFNPDEVTDHEVYVWADELNWMYLDDERENLKHLVYPNGLVVFGSIGRWDGSYSGLSPVDGNSVADCLYFETPGAEYFVEDGDLQSIEVDHDGRSHFTYRALTEPWHELERMLDYEDITVRDLIDNYTIKLGKAIGDVYGWSISESMAHRGRRRMYR